MKLLKKLDRNEEAEEYNAKSKDLKRKLDEEEIKKKELEENISKKEL